MQPRTVNNISTNAIVKQQYPIVVRCS